ncbi:MAG: beta-propeller fold lactonase family protein [Rhodothermales bacterium]|nr:beta-propeller fold lactonase family protein [Rhodothermales bacterium]
MSRLACCFVLAAFAAAGCGSTEVIDENPATAAFAVDALTVMEGGTAELTLRLTGNAPSGLTLEVVFLADAAGSTATAADLGGFDREAVTFPPGSSDGATQTVAVPVAEDDALEGDEAAVFALFPPGDEVPGVGEPSRLTLTLTDAFDFAGVEEPDWEAQVQPFLAAACGDCHGSRDPAGGLVVTDYDALLAGSDAGEALIAYDPVNSLLLELAEKLSEDDPLYEAHQLGADEAAFLRRWIEGGARGPDGEPAFADIARRLYVCNQMGGQVSVIDIDRLVVARTVTFDAYGGPMETNPHDVDVEPDGSHWYVSLIRAHRVLKYDVATNAVVDEAALGDTFFPGMLALDPTSDRLYAGRSFADNTGGQSFFALDRSDMSAEEINITYTRPHPIDVTADGAYVLSGCLAESIATAFDAETLDLVSQITVDDEATALVHYAVSPDGTRAAVTGQQSGELYFLDITDPESLEVVGTATVGQQPWHPIYSPDGAFVYVPNRESNTVSVVDAATMATVDTIDDAVLSMPHGSAITADGGLLFISNANLAQSTNPYTPRYDFGDNAQVGFVAVIDTQARAVVKVIEVEEWASGMSAWEE